MQAIIRPITTTGLYALFKAYPGERAWKAIRDMLRRPYYLSRVDHVQKVRERKQRMDTGEYSFVNMTIKTGTNYLQKRQGLSFVNLKFLVIGMKRNSSMAKIV